MNDREVIEATIIQELKAFPGIMLTQHWPRLHAQLKKYELSWSEVLRDMIESGKVKQAYKIVGTKPVAVLYLKDEIPEDITMVV